MLPFTETQLGDNVFIRKFDHNTDPIEFKWHRDNEDRRITVIGETDWLVQLENEIPRDFSEEIFIPRGVWHRTIKGKGDLVIKLEKIYTNNLK